jgi:hypothetical protein
MMDGRAEWAMSSSSVLPRKHLCGIDKADGWVDCSIFVVGVVDVSLLSQDGSDCWRSRRASVIPALSWCARFSRSIAEQEEIKMYAF